MIFFSSDHHFGHKNIIQYCNRPFSCVEEMDEFMIQKWNETVDDKDIVLYLGDFSLGKKQVREVVPKLNGIKHLIYGNHDWCHPIHSKGNQAKQEKAEGLYIESGFATVCGVGHQWILGQQSTLAHLPYRGAGDHYDEEERYGEYRLEDMGQWLLCGHVHNAWKMKRKMINVGVDMWDFKPVPVTQIERLMNLYPGGKK